jgi:predicted RNase H-like nuclease (RuvC/YqgF family)
VFPNCPVTPVIPPHCADRRQHFILTIGGRKTVETTSRLKEYRKLVEQAQSEVAALARINYRLQSRIEELEDNVRVRDERIATMQRQLNAHGGAR